MEERVLALFSLIERSLTWYCRLSFVSIFTPTTLEKIFWEKFPSPTPPTFNVGKVVEVGTWGKNACLSLHGARGRGHSWNFLNLREILKCFFHHCLYFWSGLETFSDGKIKLSTTWFLFWKSLKQTLILIFTDWFSLLLLWWLLLLFLSRTWLNNKKSVPVCFF